ncbi:MAG TPA: LPS export ABC transporter periplasmic protein LptC [Vicinamibacterales bacterium]|nr:LPS export ABC transporter periplasmic protein LptC [Vicinamibacterales bacterium]
MTLWQRRARLAIGISAIAFGLFVAFAFKRRAESPLAPPPIQHLDPGTAIVTLGGHAGVFNLSRETVGIDYKQAQVFSSGSTRYLGITMTSVSKDRKSTFKATAKEATSTKDQTSVELTGDVRLESTEVNARTEHATFTKSDNTIRAAGPVEVSEGKTSATGVGMTFDRDHDVMTIADHAVVRMASDEPDGAPTEIQCGTAVFDRRQHFRRFDHNVRMHRGSQVIEADTIVASLNADGTRMESVEMSGGTRVSMDRPTVGALQSLAGRNVTLKYAPTSEAIQRATLAGQTRIVVAGAEGQPGREIAGETMEIVLAPDGTTPTSVIARELVRLTLPAEGLDVPLRTIESATLDAKGEPRRGLTRATFSGNVKYREKGEKALRSANALRLEVGLKPGLSEIEDARFSHAVRFEDGPLSAIAAAARYDPAKGTLALSGADPAAPAPRVVNQQIAIDASAIDVTLEGPAVNAKGTVKSVLQPATKNGQSDNGVRMPAMLKQDTPVNVTADALDYDGTKSLALYTGDARLFQTDTSIKAGAITVDDKHGDLAASGGVASTTMLKQSEKDQKPDQKPREKSRSTATSKDFKYEDSIRRMTYTGAAHMTGPDGDMAAERIELYLKESGDELDRAEAYDSVTLREQNRKTTGARMTYTADNEQYIVTGTPVKIVDQCDQETSGTTLTFLKATDNIVIDGRGTRTQTRGGRGNCAAR